jgi:hypothetical protein
MSKTVYAFNARTRVYLGPLELDDGDLSPLESTEDAPIYLIPGNCLESEPPVPPEGMRVVAKNGEWAMEEVPALPEEPPTPEPTLAERAKVLLAGVDAHLDAAAQAKGYDNRNTFYMRAAVPGSPFYAEGLAFARWMDQVYAACYQLMAAVQAGDIEEPTLEQLIGMLPVLQLPE